MMHVALGLVALIAQASATTSGQEELVSRAKQLAREIVALRYIKPGLESDKERQVYEQIVKDQQERQAKLEADVIAAEGKLNMRKLLEKTAAQANNVANLVHDDESVKKDLMSLIQSASAVETQDSAASYYYFDGPKPEAAKDSGKVSRSIVGGSTEVSTPDIDLDPYDQLHQDESKKEHWWLNKLKGKGKGKFKGKAKFKGKGKLKGKGKYAGGGADDQDFGKDLSMAPATDKQPAVVRRPEKKVEPGEAKPRSPRWEAAHPDAHSDEAEKPAMSKAGADSQEAKADAWVKALTDAEAKSKADAEDKAKAAIAKADAEAKARPERSKKWQAAHPEGEKTPSNQDTSEKSAESGRTKRWRDAHPEGEKKPADKATTEANAESGRSKRWQATHPEGEKKPAKKAEEEDTGDLDDIFAGAAEPKKAAHQRVKADKKADAKPKAEAEAEAKAEAKAEPSTGGWHQNADGVWSENTAGVLPPTGAEEYPLQDVQPMQFDDNGNLIPADPDLSAEEQPAKSEAEPEQQLTKSVAQPEKKAQPEKIQPSDFAFPRKMPDFDKKASTYWDRIAEKKHKQPVTLNEAPESDSKASFEDIVDSMLQDTSSKTV